MAFISLLIILSILTAHTETRMDHNTVGQFAIGQFFAFYDAAGLCQTEFQFAVAKKQTTGSCQWKVARNFRPLSIRANDLPVEDFRGNCYFACVTDPGDNRRHTEKVINRYFKHNHIDQRQFDLYTYQAPCINCQQGRVESAELDDWGGVYYTFRPQNFVPNTSINQIFNNQLLKNGNGVYGMKALRETTEVRMAEVNQKIDEGRAARKTKHQIISTISNIDLKKAVQSYLDQHP